MARVAKRPRVSMALISSFNDEKEGEEKRSKKVANISTIVITHSKNEIFDENFEFFLGIYVKTLFNGLFSCLTEKYLINLSIREIFKRSKKEGWNNFIMRERKLLKSNMNSIEKCFCFNRLSVEIKKNSTLLEEHAEKFEAETQRQFRISDKFNSEEKDLFIEIELWKRFFSFQRILHFELYEFGIQSSIVDLHERTNFLLRKSIEEKDILTLEKLVANSFLINVHPSVKECVAGTKFEKINKIYGARLETRIFSLIDGKIFDTIAQISDMEVSICSCDDENGEQEIQENLRWEKRSISDCHGKIRNFIYVQLNSIRLNPSSSRNNRPVHGSKICRIRFQFNVKFNTLKFEKKILLFSDPFGLCSHSQYFPDYVSKILLRQISVLTDEKNPEKVTLILTDHIGRYFKRVTGFNLLQHTKKFLFDELKSIIALGSTETGEITSWSIFEEILAKIVSQIEFFVDHPFLSMMYHDGLFFGISDSKIDDQLYGTEFQPEILLRFDSLSRHMSTQQPSIRYIVHDGELTKATFQMKAFIDEMCRLIYESQKENSLNPKIRSPVDNLTFHGFSFYFDEELTRLSSITIDEEEIYKPLIPILWSTMRGGHKSSNEEKKNFPRNDFANLTRPNEFATSSFPLAQRNLLPRTLSKPLIGFLTKTFWEILTTCQTETALASRHKSFEPVEFSTNGNVLNEDLERINKQVRRLFYIDASKQQIDIKVENVSPRYFSGTTRNSDSHNVQDENVVLNLTKKR